MTKYMACKCDLSEDPLGSTVLQSLGQRAWRVLCAPGSPDPNPVSGRWERKDLLRGRGHPTAAHSGAADSDGSPRRGRGTIRQSCTQRWWTW